MSIFILGVVKCNTCYHPHHYLIKVDTEFTTTTDDSYLRSFVIIFFFSLRGFNDQLTRYSNFFLRADVIAYIWTERKKTYVLLYIYVFNHKCLQITSYEERFCRKSVGKTIIAYYEIKKNYRLHVIRNYEKKAAQAYY